MRVADDDAADAAGAPHHAGAGFKVGGEVIEVHFIAPAAKLQGVVIDLAADVPDRPEEGVIDRLLQDNLIAGMGESFDGSRQRGNDAGRKDNPFRLDFPAVFLHHPFADGAQKPRPGGGIAVERMGGAFL